MPVTPIAPPVPPVPADNAPAEAWAAYRWAVSENNRVADIEAQRDHAEAIREAGRAAAPPPPTPAELAERKRAEILRVATQIPQVTGLTELQAVDMAVKLIAAVDRRMLTASAGAV